MIGEEIQRARGLLAAVIREGMLTPEEADRAYEAWAAQSNDGPFSRHLIRSGLPADRVRLQLRRAAVLGLPSPDLHTYERFEDLLVGQLGVEAGMLSPKLLRSVRAVQDKKVAEGKLRRLSDLLPKAGVDRELLGLLYQHLQERILLCRGCLGRYPRQDLEVVSVQCPRCGEEITAEALEPSEMLELKLADEEKTALAASSAHMLATRDQDSSVTDREEKRLLPEKKSDLVLLMVVGVLSLIVVGGLVGLVLIETAPSERRPTRIASPDRTPTPTTEPAAASDSGSKAPTQRSLALIESDAIPLIRAGDYAQAQALYEASDDPGAKAKLEELRGLAAQAREVEGLLANVVPGRPAAPENERRMAQLLAAGPKYRSPPFDALARALKSLESGRRKRVRREARARFEAARQKASPDAAEWERRAAAVSRARPLYGVWLGGRVVDGVRVLAVARDRFRVGGPEGESEHTWEGSPLLGLAVFGAVADLDLPADQLELLRLALLARDPLVATRARGRLGSSLDIDQLMRAAPSSMPLDSLADDLSRRHYPLAWLGADLKPTAGTVVRPTAEALVLEGKGCGLVSEPFPLLKRTKREPLNLAVEAEVSGGGRSHIDLILEVTGSTRRYSAAWGEGRWELWVDVGAGQPTSVADGELGSASGAARLAFTGKEIVFSLGGRELGKTSVWARFPTARIAVGAEGGPLRIERLEVEGQFDRPAHERAEALYRRRVERALDRGPAAGPARPPLALSVESPQALAGLPQVHLGRLQAAKAAYFKGQGEEAEQLLRAVETESEGRLVAATYYRASLLLARFEVGAALRALEGAVAGRPQFHEARALRGLAQVLGGRDEAGVAAIDEVAPERPDLSAVHLAKAWAAHLRRDRSAPAALSVEQQELLDLALNLTPGDPLTRAIARALRRAVAQEEGRARHVGLRHAVLAGDVAAAKALCARLDQLSARFDAYLGRESGRRRPLLVASVPRDEFVVVAGPKVRVGWFDPPTRILFLEEGAAPEGRAFARAVASGDLARRFGGLPAWLETGVSEHLSATVSDGAPEDLLRIMADNEPWTAAEWRDLFALGREALQANPLARGRSLGLVSVSRQRSLDALRAAGSGKAVEWPTQELTALEEAVGAWVSKSLAD